MRICDTPRQLVRLAWSGGCTTRRGRLYWTTRALAWWAYLKAEEADLHWPWPDPRPPDFSGAWEKLAGAIKSLGISATEANTAFKMLRATLADYESRNEEG